MKWHRTDKEEPETGRYVLMGFRDGRIYMGVRRPNRWAKTGQWYFSDGHRPMRSVPPCWMELPEVPKWARKEKDEQVRMQKTSKV